MAIVTTLHIFLQTWRNGCFALTCFYSNRRMWGLAEKAVFWETVTGAVFIFKYLLSLALLACQLYTYTYIRQPFTRIIWWSLFLNALPFSLFFPPSLHPTGHGVTWRNLPASVSVATDMSHWLCGHTLHHALSSPISHARGGNKVFNFHIGWGVAIWSEHIASH